MESILHSFLLVAASEMGDKTQLLAILLATRFRSPKAVLAGIFVATVANHLLASLLGSWVSLQISPTLLKWILCGIFFAFALWILIPDKDDAQNGDNRFGAFFTTLVAFFLAEMGDKTQLATVALALKYKSVVGVTIGSTMGMMLADGLAVVFGKKLLEKISMRWIRIASSVLFILFGLGILFEYV